MSKTATPTRIHPAILARNLRALDSYIFGEGQVLNPNFVNDHTRPAVGVKDVPAILKEMGPGAEEAYDFVSLVRAAQLCDVPLVMQVLAFQKTKAAKEG